MHPIKYQVVGEEDYAFMITVHSNGDFDVSAGTYTSDPPRTGKLSDEQQAALLAAIRELGIPDEHAKPGNAADAFNATLVVGEGDGEVSYPFWEGALKDDPKLLKLVRLLEKI